jgi:hypothetical protein
MTNRRFFQIVLLIMLFASLTRLLMINHHDTLVVEDEGGDLSYAVRLIEGNPPNLRTLYHRTFIIYHDAFAVGIYAGFKFLTGQVQSVSDLQNDYFANRQEFVIATRLWIGFLTVCAVGLVAFIGRYFSPQIGIFSALVLALHTFVTYNSVYALPDALIIFAVALNLWLVMRVYHYRRTRDYVLWGLFFVWVMITKLIAAPIAIALVIAHTAIAYETAYNSSIQKDEQKDEQKYGQQSAQPWRVFLRVWIFNKNVWITTVMLIVGHVLFNPFLVAYPTEMMTDLGKISGMFGRQGSAPTLELYVRGWTEAFAQLITLIWRWWLPMTLIGVGMAWTYRRSVPYWMLLSVWLLQGLYLLHNMTNSYSQVYYWTSWVISLSLVTGIGLASVWQWAQMGGWWRVGYVAIAGVLLAEGAMLASYIQLVRQPTTQDLARAFIHANIPADAKMIAGDGLTYTVPLQRNITSIDRATAMRGNPLNVWAWYQNLSPQDRPAPAYDIYGPEVQSQLETLDELQTLIQSENITYYITMEYCRGFTYSPDSESALDFPPNSPLAVAGYVQMAVFSPFTTNTCENEIATRTGLSYPPTVFAQHRAGPIITIYQIPQAGA